MVTALCQHGWRGWVELGVRNPTLTNCFWDLGPTWDVWGQKPNIYELFFLDFGLNLDVLCQKPNIYELFFGIWDPPGMFGVGNPTFTNYAWDFGPTWDVWCQKPNIYELFLGFGTQLGCLVSEP